MPRKVTAPGVVLPRLKQHRAMLNKILSNERISGSRRILAEFLAVWMDLYDHPDEQKQILEVLRGAWGDAKRVRWNEDDESAISEGQSNMDKETVQQIKSLFDVTLKESSNVVPTT